MNYLTNDKECIKNLMDLELVVMVVQPCDYIKKTSELYAFLKKPTIYVAVYELHLNFKKSNVEHEPLEPTVPI